MWDSMNIKPAINEYYLEIISSMIAMIENSEAGKRMWQSDEVTGRCDYSLTTRSTYPTWCKFYYVRTPKKKRMDYIFDDTRKPYQDGYFNGATKDLIGIFKMYKKGYMSKSERVQIIFDDCVAGYMDDLKEIEYINAQYEDNANSDFNFDDIRNDEIIF